ncbi:MAG: L,D-transpeptidase family protein [Magnetospirillum sp.]|nr:L,D-transpeptidase family protein [Magnetospirillum sp.]
MLLRTLAVSLILFARTALAALAADPTEVEQRLEGSEPTALVAGRTLDMAPLRDFYRQRGWRLAWSGPTGEELGDRLLIDAQAVAIGEGLPPEPYAVPAAESDLDHDLLISDALRRLGRDLAVGQTMPHRWVGGMGAETRPRFDGLAFLAGLAAGTALPDAIATLVPADPGYRQLKAALPRARDLVRAGGWAPVPEGPLLKPGQVDAIRIPALRRRLAASGELAAGHEKGHSLDAPLTAALKRFQEHHGLDADGALGKKTVAALNVSAEDRLKQIVVNLERHRWMPRSQPERRIAVNLPAATLELYIDGQPAYGMRVVVGDAKHPTPPMVATMTAVVLNPSWTIPAKIAAREILPKLKKDPNYLAANNMRILDTFPEGSPQSSGHGIDWAQQHAASFPFRLRQQPGPDNALGRLKFTLTDSDDIYLHDTPQRRFFSRDRRALSHGCVRLEQPVELAGKVLGGEWDGPRIDAALAAEPTTRTIRLEQPLTVYLTYFTAWTDAAGEVHFSDDLYGHDARLKGVLSRRARGGSEVAEGASRSTL